MVQVCDSYIAFCTCDDVYITCETGYQLRVIGY